MDPREHLLKAADDMAQYGQAKEALFNTSDEHPDWQTAPACALGALARTYGDKYVLGILMGYASKLLADTVRAKLNRQDMNDYQAITFYNDMDSTSREDMILTFKEAAHG